MSSYAYGKDSKEKVPATGKKVPFSVVEAYKTIRTNLLFMLAQDNRKCITISSSIPEEGKSTTVVNIAIAFSQLGIKVLLIDGDLRKPTIHKKMKLENTKGLSSVLAGFSPFEETVISVNKSLDVLTAGPIPPNPSEMLSSNRADALLESLQEKYDYVIIDTPPINVVSDALVLAPKTSGLILIVRENFTIYSDIKRALSAIEIANIRLLGTVINDAGAYEGKGYRSGKYYKNRFYKRYYKYGGSYGRYGKYYSSYDEYGYSSSKENAD